MKSLIVIGGANGSGKTTFAKAYAKTKSLPFVNADEIAAELNQSNIRAGKRFLNQIAAHLRNDESLIVESTLSGHYLERFIQLAKSRGYSVVLHYLYLENPQECIARVRNRVLNGGHHVPEEDVVRRFHRSRALFWNLYAAQADEWRLFLNADDEFEEIASFSNSELVIFNEHQYEIFKDRP